VKKIVGFDEDGYYLLDLGTEVLEGLSQHVGQIYYEDKNRFYPPTNFDSLASRQEWDLYTGSQDVPWLTESQQGSEEQSKQQESDIETM